MSEGVRTMLLDAVIENEEQTIPLDERKQTPPGDLAELVAELQVVREVLLPTLELIAQDDLSTDHIMCELMQEPMCSTCLARQALAKWKKQLAANGEGSAIVSYILKKVKETEDARAEAQSYKEVLEQIAALDTVDGRCGGRCGAPGLAKTALRKAAQRASSQAAPI